VFLDLTIKGGMGGKECIIKLKEIDPNIKAIVYSGYSTDPVMTEYQKYGFKAVLKKPFNVAQLKKTISDTLNCDNDYQL
jgi:DNA-binding NtrC family response regulator